MCLDLNKIVSITPTGDFKNIELPILLFDLWKKNIYLYAFQDLIQVQIQIQILIRNLLFTNLKNIQKRLKINASYFFILIFNK